jgi:type IV pilus assembly protein PilF
MSQSTSPDGWQHIGAHFCLSSTIQSKLSSSFLPLRAPSFVPGNVGLRGSISGQVLLPSGQQPNFRIRVTLSGYRVPSVTAYTDNKGKFTISGISDGTYSLEVEAESGSYQTVYQEVRVIYGAHPMLVITLRERGSAKQQSTGVVSASELAPELPEAARKEYEKGVQYSDKGKIEDAVDRFKKAISIAPNYLMAHNNLGVQYLKLGKWVEAGSEFEKAIAIDEKALNPRQNLGIALIELQHYQKAIEHLNQAISIDSSSPVAHLYLGIASIGVNEIDQAERELTTTLSLAENKYPNAHFYLGLVHMRKGEREQAIRELKTYVGQSPNGEKVARAKQLLDKLKN